MGKQLPYDSDAEAALKLSAAERRAARALKAKRPEVIPNTRVIINRAEACVWFNDVTAAMVELSIITPDKVAAFCDLAGVPD